MNGSLPITLNSLSPETGNDKILEIVISYVLKRWPRKKLDPDVKPYFNCRLQFIIG